VRHEPSPAHGGRVTAGPLQPLLEEPGVTDVLVNSPTEVWVDRGAGLEPAGVHLGDEEAVRSLAVRLAASTGRRLDAASPHVDVRLPGGVRLHAVLPPIAVTGTHLSFRVLRTAGLGLDALVPPDEAALLRAVVTARLAVLVSGGTGTGKTTLLQALLGEVDPVERLVIVEDAAELAPAHPHVVRLEARPANVEGAGAIPLRRLVREALRMRPDRLVVGEVRGAEVAELLLALNTGHEGGATTLHANGAVEVPARLQALGALAGLGPAAVVAQAGAALHVVVHLRRRGRERAVETIGVVQVGPAGPGAPPGLVVAPAWQGGQPGPVAAVLAALIAGRGARPPAALLNVPDGSAAR